MRKEEGEREAPLWAYLDRHGVPFRNCVETLTRLHDETASYPGGPPVVALPSGPWMDVLSTPWSVLAFGGLTPALPEMSAEIYGPDWQDNLRKGIETIRAEFGKPDRTVDQNAKGAIWNIGLGEINCLAWPPEDNPYPNARHDALPQTKTAARLSITPAWRPPVAPELRALIADLPCLYHPADPKDMALGAIAAFEHRPWPDQPKQGVWGTREADIILLSYQDRPVLLSPYQQESITMDILRPARGGGALGFALHVSGAPGRGYPLCHRGFDDSEIAPMRTKAKLLAEALGLPFDLTEELDI